MPANYSPQNVSTISQILGSKGWTDSQIAGVIGNMKIESGFDPNAYNMSGTVGPLGGGHVGIIQWDAGRQANLVDFANKNGLDPRDVQTQALFINAEATNPAYGEVASYQRFFNNSATPEQAASNYNQYVERSGEAPGTAIDVKRQNAAAAYASNPNNPQFGNGAAVPADLKEAGYTYAGADEGGAFYSNPNNPNQTIQYNTDTKQWEKYDANTGEAITNADGSTAVAEGFNPAPPPNAGGAGVGPAGGAAAAGGAQVLAGGAGCLSGGLTPAATTVAGGLMANAGAIAQSAAINAGMSLLSGGGIQGAMGAAFGSIAGAVGSSIGAALGGAAGSLGNMLGGIAGQALGGVVGAIASGKNPLQAITGAAFGALSQMGGALIPGLSNVMPPGLASAAIGGLTGVLGAVASGVPAGAAAQFALAGGLGGALNGVVSNMTGNYTLGSISGAVASGALNGTLSSLYSQASGQIDLSRYSNLIMTAAAVASQNRTIVGSVAEAMSQNFGNGVGGVGAATRNMQDAMTFSVSTLGQNISAVSADLIAMGTWDASNLMRLMQPGNVATQIMSKGLGDFIGLTDAFTQSGIPVAGLDNPIYDRITLAVLSTINDPEAINTVMTAFNMGASFKNLAQLCDLPTMMPRSASYLPVRNFRELGVQFAVIGVNSASTVQHIGIAFSKIETSTDLNHISQLAQPLPAEIGSQLMQVYGYGGGAYGEQTMADIIGTPAGYVHSDTIPVIVSTNKYIEAHPEAATLVTLTELLKNTAEGMYTDLGTDGDTAADPPIPGEDGGITVPFPAGSQTFSTLDDALLAFIPLIEAEHQALLNTTDPALLDAINKLNVAWSASCAQIVKENNNLKAHGIDLFNPIPPSPNTAIMFAQMLEVYAGQTEYGQIAHYLERVATPDVYGDAVKYCMRQARNGAALRDLGVDPDKYKLPQSQYYRNPSAFYENLYTGKMPPTPRMQSAESFPRTPQETYLYNRNLALDSTGYRDSSLLNNQKDEIYYDSIWMNTDNTVLEGIGRNVVKNAIDNNIQLSGNDLMIRDTKGNMTKIGEIKETGLLLTNNDYFVTTMMQLVNRLLYGDLVTTKYTNPFNTDQMVYGLLELLAQVNNQNINALLQTVTGGLIASGLLAQLVDKFSTSRSLFDTTMDRNDPGTWGGVGPDAVPDPRPRLL